MTRAAGAKSAASGTSTDSGPRTYTFVANDGKEDRSNDRNSVSGWNLADYNRNGVVFYNHDSGLGGFLGLGKKDVLPIGKGHAYVQGEALMVDIQFDQKDAFAKQVEQKVADGFLNAVSVGYRMTGDVVDNELGGVDSSGQDLLEISVVTIPANQRALRVKDFGDELDPILIEIADRVAEKLAAKAAPQPKPKFTDNDLKAVIAEAIKSLIGEK